MMESEEKCDMKCPRCGTYRFPSQFISKNRTMKSCQVCRDNAKISREKNKCEHNRERNKCKNCGGSSICEHNRQRSRCKDCGGVSICIHNRRRNICKNCDGSQICEHNRQRNICKNCDGSQICSHSKVRNKCKNCMNDEQKIDYIQKTMISNSRQKDKKKNRYDPDHFIDKCFLEGLFEDNNTCHYCSVEFTYNECCGTFVTIERLDNAIGHIKSNCVLACLKCNKRHNQSEH